MHNKFLKHILFKLFSCFVWLQSQRTLLIRIINKRNHEVGGLIPFWVTVFRFFILEQKFDDLYFLINISSSLLAIFHAFINLEFNLKRFMRSTVVSWGTRIKQHKRKFLEKIRADFSSLPFKPDCCVSILCRELNDKGFNTQTNVIIKRVDWLSIKSRLNRSIIIWHLWLLTRVWGVRVLSINLSTINGEPKRKQTV